MIYLIEIGFIVVNTIFAFIQINIRKIDLSKNKEGGIKHGAWLALYLMLMGVVWLIGFHSWALMVCLAIMRIIYFNPLFNFLAGNPFFHLGEKSVIDRLIAPVYKPLYFICLVAFFVLQFVL